MSISAQARLARKSASTATLFAALGDPTRLALVTRLGDGSRQSITQLAAGRALTRQAISKHLRVLEEAGLVTSIKQGKEVLYVLDAGAVDDARAFLDGISAGWDRAIARLKALVEDE